MIWKTRSDVLQAISENVPAATHNCLGELLLAGGLVSERAGASDCNRTRGMKMDGHLGRRLREARYARGLSQKKLARRVDVDHTWISHIESGRHQPGVALVHRLAKTLSVRFKWLMTGEDR